MYVNSPEGLRIRNLPSINGERIGLLENFTKVNVVKEDLNVHNINGTEGRWVYISTPIEGWIFDGFLTDLNINDQINQYDFKIEEYFSEVENEENFEYFIRSFANNTIEITGYLGENTRVWIPSTIRGIQVSLIGGAFNNKGLLAVKIPNTVYTIGQNSFSNNELTNIVIPYSVHAITHYAFHNNKLTNVELHDNIVYLGIRAFTENPIVRIKIGANVNLAESEYMKEGIVFDNDFDNFYTENGSRAGVYIYSNGNWRMQ
jgi:hypothetical protein